MLSFSQRGRHITTTNDKNTMNNTSSDSEASMLDMPVDYIAPGHGPAQAQKESLRKSNYVARSFVQHNYCDRSRETPIESDYFSRGQEGALRFPLKLHQALNNMESDGLGGVCSWQLHGRAFKVHDQIKFKEVMPQYFGTMKFASFQRQLNLCESSS